MKIEVAAHTSPPTGWDDRIAMAGVEAGLLQSVYWGSLMNALGRGKPLYLEALINDRAVASLLVVHITNVVQRHSLGVRTLAGWVGLGSRLEFADGPVIYDETVAENATDALLNWLDGYMVKNRISVVRCNGLSPAGSFVAHPIANTGIRSVFAAHGYKRSSWGTYLVDLSQPDETLFKSIEHAARKGVKKSAREGVVVERLDTWEEYLNRFLLPYLSWTQNQGKVNVSVEEARLIWGHPGHHDYYRYYAAVHTDGTVLGVLGMYLSGGVATEITSGMGPAALERKLPAQDVLHWEMFLDAKRMGCHTFNLAGVSPLPQTPKEENIRRFKKKWGGRYLEYDRYELLGWPVSWGKKVIGWWSRPGFKTEIVKASAKSLLTKVKL